MTDVTEEAETVVENTDLPKRLKDEIYATIEPRDDVDVDHVEDIVQAVESQYLQTRVDPLDPVGTVSAQSIGEPGTQMSVPYDERILIRTGTDGTVEESAIGPLVDDLMQGAATRSVDSHEVARVSGDLEVLSLGEDASLAWQPLAEVSRHAAPEELLRVELASGRSIRATKAHSFVTQTESGVAPIAASRLDVGDHLPVAGAYDAASEVTDFTAYAQPPAADGGTVTTEPASGRRVVGQAGWERITAIDTVTPRYASVYDVSVAGLETFTTADGVVTHNTMNTFHYAGVAEIDVTQGLPRLIELVDARKTPDTPMMTVHLEGEYAEDRERAHEVVWKIEATRILALGDVSTNVADMLVRIDLNDETLQERWPTVSDLDEIAGEIADTIESALGVETARPETTVIEFGPEQPSYRELLQLVEELREVVFKGIDEISRVVIRKEDTETGEEFVLYTEGSSFGDVLEIEGVDASRTTCNNIHEIHQNLGIEAARERIIDETMNTLEEQGLDDVNIRHLMLVADIMTNNGDIESIGRHGISGNKDSVLARAAFEVTVNHLLDAAIHGEVDDLDGVTENVIVGKPIKLGTGDVDLRMGAKQTDGPPADD